MYITSDIALNQDGLKRRRRRFRARVLRLVAAGSLIAYVFIFPLGALGAVSMAFIPLELVLYGSARDRIVWLPVCLAGVAAVYVMIALISSRKTPVLYLRRFGFRDANRMITRAIEEGLGRQYRVLTLDDSDFAPLEVPRIERIVSRLGIPLALLLLVVGIIEVTGGQSVLHVPTTLVAIIDYLVPLGYAAFLLALPFVTLMVLAAVVLVWRWRIRRSFKVEIRSAKQLERCLIRVKRLTGWLRRPSMVAPQALVIRVVDQLWQEVVSDLAEQVRLVICDVSEPTANLEWEVESMLARPRVKCLFVGEGPMVRNWAQTDSDSKSETPVSRMRILLQDHTVLVFEPAQRFAQRVFNRNLRNSLENASNQPR
jgi:hypothetical protein